VRCETMLGMMRDGSRYCALRRADVGHMTGTHQPGAPARPKTEVTKRAVRVRTGVPTVRDLSSSRANFLITRLAQYGV